MAKKKAARPKPTKAASRKTAKQPAARRGRKTTAAKQVGKRAAARRGATKKSKDAQRKTAARPARRTPAKATKRAARAAPPPAPSKTRTAAAPKAAPRPKRPRRTTQAMPPQPRTIPTPVVDVQPVAPAAPAAPAAKPILPAPVVSPPSSAASAPTPILGGQPPAAIRNPAPAGQPSSGATPASPAPSTATALKVGDAAPEFSLPDEKGAVHRLADFRGQKVVLYFYPKDDTPGCTTEACGFRDRHADFTNRNAAILGVSADTSESHQRFIQKFGLNFPLLADVNHRVAENYGVWVQKQRAGTPYMGIARTTFIIDAAGRIVHIFRNVRPEEHEAEVLRALEPV